MQDREVITFRAPKALVKKLDDQVRRRQRELGTSKWSRNDELTAIVEAALREGGR